MSLFSIAKIFSPQPGVPLPHHAQHRRVVAAPKAALHKNFRFGCGHVALCTAMLIMMLLPVAVSAQTNCNEGAGPLVNEQPKGITTDAMIQKFTAQESFFKEAQTHYAFTPYRRWQATTWMANSAAYPTSVSRQGGASNT